MSTTTLVILALFTAVAAVGALWFLRWQEQKRLARARAAVAHSDAIGEVLLIGDTLSKWLSPNAMKYLADRIYYHQQKLNELRIAPDQRLNRALDCAVQWSNHAPQGRSPLPSQNKQAQDIRTMLQRLIEHVRKDYQAHNLGAEVARPLLAEAKILNIKLAVAVFESKATAAATVSNNSVAVHYLRKAIAAIKTISPLPDELQALTDQLNTKLQELLQSMQQTNSSTRLEEAAEQMAAEEDAWKKKHF